MPASPGPPSCGRTPPVRPRSSAPSVAFASRTRPIPRRRSPRPGPQRHCSSRAFWRRSEWKLIEMPLPRLQVMGGVCDPFIYRIAWTTASPVRRRARRRLRRPRAVRRHAASTLSSSAACASARSRPSGPTASCASTSRSSVTPVCLSSSSAQSASRSLRCARCSVTSRAGAASTAGGSSAPPPTSTTSCPGRGGPTTAWRTSLRRTRAATPASATSSPRRTISKAGCGALRGATEVGRAGARVLRPPWKLGHASRAHLERRSRDLSARAARARGCGWRAMPSRLTTADSPRCWRADARPDSSAGADTG